jgi:hypothetical protein
MKVNYNYYKLDVADIWQYERLLFLSDKNSIELAKNIIDKVEAIIIKDGIPVFGKDYFNSADEKIQGYYERNKRDYAEASKTLKDRFRIDFFFNKYSCFQYDQTIIINNDNVDFDFWFALKLRQYVCKISELKNFLNFQLDTNFNNEIDEFINFLKLSIRQYQSELLDKKVVDTVSDWADNKPKLNIGIQTNDLSSNKIIDDRLILSINYDSLELFESLKAFFDEKDHEKLTLLLNKEEIIGEICFSSNANQLVMVFRQLHLNQKIIGSLVNTKKWICKYFTYYGQNKKLSNFNAENVHKILTKIEYDIPKSKRIDLPGLKYIKNKP